MQYFAVRTRLDEAVDAQKNKFSVYDLDLSVRSWLFPAYFFLLQTEKNCLIYIYLGLTNVP